MTAFSGNFITSNNSVTNSFENCIILIVDDVPNNLKMLSDTLANAGFEVAIATSSESALQQNQGFAKVAGLSSPNQIIGKSDYDLRWSQKEVDWYRSCDRRVMESGEAELHIIEQLRRADGEQIWLNTNKIPLRDADDNLFGILLVTDNRMLSWTVESGIYEYFSKCY